MSGLIVLAATAALAVDAVRAQEAHEQLTPLALLGLLAVYGGRLLLTLWREWLEATGRRGGGSAGAGAPNGRAGGVPDTAWLLRLERHMVSEEQQMGEFAQALREGLRASAETQRDIARQLEVLGRRLEGLDRRLADFSSETTEILHGLLRQRLTDRGAPS